MQLDVALGDDCGRRRGEREVELLEANGLAGPDLTHIGTRQSLGAGILPNNRGTLIGWIGNSQAIKPGNRMPPYTMLPGEDLQALADYMQAQK